MRTVYPILFHLKYCFIALGLKYFVQPVVLMAQGLVLVSLPELKWNYRHTDMWVRFISTSYTFGNGSSFKFQIGSLELFIYQSIPIFIQVLFLNYSELFSACYDNVFWEATNFNHFVIIIISWFYVPDVHTGKGAGLMSLVNFENISLINIHFIITYQAIPRNLSLSFSCIT